MSVYNMPSAESVLANLNRARHQKWCLEQRLKAVESPIMRSAVDLAQTFDPNWYSVTIWEPRRYGSQQVEVFVNGPLLGDGLLTAYLQEEFASLSLEDDLHEWNESCDEDGRIYYADYCLRYFNPHHRWEVKPGNLIFELFGGKHAHVHTVNSNGTFVVRVGHKEERYTAERLNEELAYPHECNQVKCAHYVPFRLPESRHGHHVFQTISEFYSAQHKLCKQKEVKEQW